MPLSLLILSLITCVVGSFNYDVTVGQAGQLAFYPSTLNATVGDTVTYHFFAKNHSVTQSSFDNPCHQLASGFFSGFIPTPDNTHSPTTWTITLNDTKPIWIYCGQTNGDHCQKGMVQAINAPTTGNTFDAYKQKAVSASTSTSPPDGLPVGGVLKVNGTVVGPSSDGNPSSSSVPLGTSSSSSTPPAATSSSSGNPALGKVPPPGTGSPAYLTSMAGGGPPVNYNWAPTISDNATSLLQLLCFLDNILLELLFDGHNNLTSGSWKDQYPQAITDALGSMSAQALVHRSTATDTLEHYNKPLSPMCTYYFPGSTVTDFIDVALVLLLLEIGIILDVTTLTAVSDAWLTPALSTNLGSKSRMTAVINMMQNHLASTAPREVMIPARLVYSYAMTHYVVRNSCSEKLPYTVLPELSVTKVVDTGSQRTTGISFTLSDSIKNTSGLYVAWLGPWGDMQFSLVTMSGQKGSASVPTSLFGHVWALVVTAQGIKLQDLSEYAVAGPEVVWVTQPS